jgi:hypothetical protein
MRKTGDMSKKAPVSGLFGEVLFSEFIQNPTIKKVKGKSSEKFIAIEIAMC